MLPWHEVREYILVADGGAASDVWRAARGCVRGSLLGQGRSLCDCGQNVEACDLDRAVGCDGFPGFEMLQRASAGM